MPFCDIVLRAQKPCQRPDYPIQPRTIGEHIKKRRYDLNLTQKHVAEFFGVARNTISDWEWNTAIPNIVLMPKLIEFIGYNLFGDISKMGVGEQIRTSRMLLGLKLNDAARQFGVCKDTFAAWERGSIVRNKAKRNDLQKFITSSCVGITGGH